MVEYSVFVLPTSMELLIRLFSVMLTKEASVAVVGPFPDEGEEGEEKKLEEDFEEDFEDI